MGRQNTIVTLGIEGVSVCIILCLSVYLFHPTDPGEIPRDPAIDTSYCDQINRRKPDVVFIGNSILQRGLSRKQFTVRTGLQTSILTSPGSASAWWYVVTKNVVTRCYHKPRVLAIVFRDTFLTKPTYRVTGMYREKIDRFAGVDEPILNELAYYRSDSPIESFLNKYYSPFFIRAALKKRISVFLQEMVERLTARPPQTVAVALKESFAEKKYNPALLTKTQLAAERTGEKSRRDFYTVLKHSFLPHIISETQRARIQLILIRAKKRRTVNHPKDPPTLRAYFKDLRSYLKSENVPLWDYTSIDTITWQHYKSGDHLNAEGREIFTAHVAADFNDFFDSRN